MVENELLERVSWFVNPKRHFWGTGAAAARSAASWGGTRCAEEDAGEEKAKEEDGRCSHEQEDAGRTCVGLTSRREELRHDQRNGARPANCEEDVEEGRLRREPEFHLVSISIHVIRRTEFSIRFEGEAGEGGKEKEGGMIQEGFEDSTVPAEEAGVDHPGNGRGEEGHNWNGDWNVVFHHPCEDQDKEDGLAYKCEEAGKEEKKKAVG